MARPADTSRHLTRRVASHQEVFFVYIAHKNTDVVCVLNGLFTAWPATMSRIELLLRANYRSRMGGTPMDGEQEPQIALYCGLQSCAKPIVQTLGRGRRKEFCSETCRRAADRDYKRAKSHADLFEEQLRKARHQVASYGRKSDEGRLTPEEIAQQLAEARVALARATVVVELGASPERVLAELQALVTATRPVLERDLPDPLAQTA